MRLRNLHSAAIVTVATALILPGGFALGASDLDSRIEASAKASYNFKTYLKDDSIKIQSADGVVTLTGRADSEAHKELVGVVAKDVEGGRTVRNQLVVAAGEPAVQPLTEKVDDASITAQVKTVLLFHKSTHALATKVATTKGVVTLRGEAVNEAEKDLVTKLAEDIQGVKQVKNRMSVQKS
jgi:osmotically-inducible protein OsmY